MFVVLAVITVYVFRVVLISWSGQETRAGIDIALDRGIEEMVRDFREAREVDSVNDDEIRFTQDASTYYIYYFYDESDAYPPDFDQDSYELRKAALSGGINGTFAYGSGQLVITDIVPPITSDLSISNNIIIIDLSITRGDETIRSRTKVKPRNLQI